MISASDRERVRSLLTETMMLLCRTSLHFESSFSVEALIGITIDKTEVLLVNIKESIEPDIEEQREGCREEENNVEKWNDNVDNYENRGKLDNDVTTVNIQRNDATTWRVEDTDSVAQFDDNVATIKTQYNNEEQNDWLRENNSQSHVVDTNHDRINSIKEENAEATDHHVLRKHNRLSDTSTSAEHVSDWGSGINKKQNLDMHQEQHGSTISAGSRGWSRKRRTRKERQTSNYTSVRSGRDTIRTDTADCQDAIIIADDGVNTASCFTNDYFGRKSTDYPIDAMSSSHGAAESIRYPQTIQQVDNDRSSYQTNVSSFQHSSNASGLTGQGFAFKQGAQMNGVRYPQHHRGNDSVQGVPYSTRRHSKMYSCPYCHRTLKCIRNLRGHMAAQHNQTKEFSCTCCDKQFAYKTSLKTHMITAHNKTTFF